MIPSSNLPTPVSFFFSRITNWYPLLCFSSSKKDNPRWFMVDVKYVRDTKRYISLAELKGLYQKHSKSKGPLRNLALFTRARLSVQPLTEGNYSINIVCLFVCWDSGLFVGLFVCWFVCLFVCCGCLFVHLSLPEPSRNIFSVDQRQIYKCGFRTCDFWIHELPLATNWTI